MTQDRSPRQSRTARGPVAIASVGARIVADLVVVGLWVLFLTLLFLSTGWPRWAFYGSLVLGVACYVQFTAPWGRSKSEPGSEAGTETGAAADD